jgi:hypothetical protein
MLMHDTVAIEEIKKHTGGSMPDACFHGEKHVDLRAFWFFLGPLISLILRRLLVKYYLVALRGEIIFIVFTNNKCNKFEDTNLKIHKSEIVNAKGWKNSKLHNFHIELRDGSILKFHTINDDVGNVSRFEKFLNIVHPVYERVSGAQRPWQGTALSFLFVAISIFIIGQMVYGLVNAPLFFFSAFSALQVLASALFLFIARKIYIGKLWSINISITLGVLTLLVIGQLIIEVDNADPLLKVFGAFVVFAMYLGIVSARDPFYKIWVTSQKNN